jgi:hypothetical protein
MSKKQLFYIGERVNPQLKKSYYVAYGQLGKREARDKEDCAYGSMYINSYETEEEYGKEIIKLKENGFNVNMR